MSTQDDHGGLREWICIEALDAWAYEQVVKLDFIRSGKPFFEFAEQAAKTGLQEVTDFYLLAV